LVEGIDWKAVVPGVRIEIGGALLEVTQFCNPCHKQTANFTAGNYMIVNNLKAPGRSRVYCAVLRDGNVAEGDPAKLHVQTLGAKVYTENPCVLGRRAAPGGEGGAQHGPSARLGYAVCLATGMLIGLLLTASKAGKAAR